MIRISKDILSETYGAHSVTKSSNKLIYLANKISQFFLFNKRSL